MILEFWSKEDEIHIIETNDVYINRRTESFSMYTKRGDEVMNIWYNSKHFTKIFVNNRLFWSEEDGFQEPPRLNK